VRLSNEDKALEDIELFNAFPKLEIVRQIWNLTETNFAKLSRNMTMDTILTNKKFSIDPETFKSFFPVN
jgi:hypothetical protein